MKTTSGLLHSLLISGQMRSKLIGVKSLNHPHQCHQSQGLLHIDRMIENSVHIAKHAEDPLLKTIIISADDLLLPCIIDPCQDPPTPEDITIGHYPLATMTVLHTDSLDHQHIIHLTRLESLQVEHWFQESKVLFIP